MASDKKSILLLGPRQTGKSTLISGLKPDLSINFAHEATFLDFAKNPSELENRLASLKPAENKTIFIDEIQRLPSVLNTIQTILDQPKCPYRFLLTGSSARKLRRGNANLLPGRIHTFYLGPIVVNELNYTMNTTDAMSTGTLPGILTEPDISTRQKTLRSYAATYLREEVQAESLTRNLEGFSRFLSIVAGWAGHFLDLSKMAMAAQVARQSAVRYFEILEDCLIVYRANSFAKSLTRRLVQHPKFYFFDVGVLNGLLGNFEVSSDRIGLLFEHLIFTQLVHSASAHDQEIRVSTFRTEHGAEIDFIVEIKKTTYAIELKASRNISQGDLHGFKRFSDYFGKKHRQMILYLGDTRKKISHIDILPWQDGFRKLGL